jgi:hypothetical protein
VVRGAIPIGVRVLEPHVCRTRDGPGNSYRRRRPSDCARHHEIADTQLGPWYRVRRWRGTLASARVAGGGDPIRGGRGRTVEARAARGTVALALQVPAAVLALGLDWTGTLAMVWPVRSTTQNCTSTMPLSAVDCCEAIRPTANKVAPINAPAHDRTRLATLLESPSA